MDSARSHMVGLILIALSFVASGCSVHEIQPQRHRGLDLIPLGVGNEWILESTQNPGDYVSIKAVDSQVTALGTFYVVEERIRRISGRQRILCRYLAGNIDSVTLVAIPVLEPPSHLDFVHLSKDSVHKFTWYRFNAQKDDRWMAKMAFAGPRLANDVLLTLIATSEQVGTQIGSFGDCRSFDVDVQGMYDEKYRDWVARGVGIVKRQYGDEEFLLSRLQLR